MRDVVTRLTGSGAVWSRRTVAQASRRMPRRMQTDRARQVYRDCPPRPGRCHHWMLYRHLVDLLGRAVLVSSISRKKNDSGLVIVTYIVPCRFHVVSAAVAVITDILFFRSRARHYNFSDKKNAGALVIVTSMVNKNPGYARHCNLAVTGLSYLSHVRTFYLLHSAVSPDVMSNKTTHTRWCIIQVRPTA